MGTENAIRWGMLGYGAVTEKKSGPAFAKAKGGCLYAVAGRHPERAKEYAARHHVPRVFDSMDALLACPEVDAVYIATPPSSHLHLALKVAEAGKPCCVEKPMALTVAECEQMNAAFDAKGLPLFVSYYRRSLPRFLQIKRWIDEGAIGPVRHLHWQLSRTLNPKDAMPPHPWRLLPEVGGEGYFYDIGSHGLDLFMYLLGPITVASGHSTRQSQCYPAVDAVAGSWQFASGALGSGFWNFNADARCDQVQILGAEGRIEFSVLDEQPLRLTREGDTESVEIPNPDPVQLPHVTQLNAHLQGRLTHPATGRAAAECNRVMSSILGHSLAT